MEFLASSGFCKCGCGELTEIADRTRSSRNQVKGEPLDYVKGHVKRRSDWKKFKPNFSGYCHCGCGEKTKIATKTSFMHNQHKGYAINYIPGHQSRRTSKSSPIEDWEYTLKEKELYWIAGLIEGEGYFGIRKRKGVEGTSYGFSITVAMTDEDVINKLHRLVPLGSVCKENRITKGGKNVWRWHLSNSSAVRDFLITIFPLMSSRRQDRIRKILAHPTYIEGVS